MLGRLLAFAAVPFGALLLMWLAFVDSFRFGMPVYMLVYFLFPYALLPFADGPPRYEWLIAIAMSVLVAGLTIALSQHRSMRAACAIYAGLTLPISILVHVLVGILDHPWNLLVIE